MALSENAKVTIGGEQMLQSLPVAAAVRIFKGALVGTNAVTSAGIKPFVAGDQFVGIAYEEANNTSGAAAAINCRIYTACDFVFTLSGVSTSNTGNNVSATADDAISIGGLTAALCGKIIKAEATNLALVRMRPWYGPV